MRELEQALEEVRVLHERIFGHPAPSYDALPYVPMPPGIDPVELSLQEVRKLRELSDGLALMPRSSSWRPVADSFVTEDEWIIQLEIPGVSREDLKVFVQGGECVVQGERKPPHKLGSMRPLVLERPWGPFERRFILPVGSRPEKVAARVSGGVLELHIPLERAATPKEQIIEVD